MRTTVQRSKTYYSEPEAAAELGISVPDLRTMIQTHIIAGDELGADSEVGPFQRSDLLLLRMLAGHVNHE